MLKHDQLQNSTYLNLAPNSSVGKARRRHRTKFFHPSICPKKIAKPADRVKNCVITLSNWLHLTVILAIYFSGGKSRL
ncbi:hypothetical protein ACWATR_39500, partial [Nostoc sp. UIC 10890]